MNEDAHPAGFYEGYPQVTWDLAEERWLAARGRSDVLIACCRSCDEHITTVQVAATPANRRTEEAIATAQHWYQCPEKGLAMEFLWLGAYWDEIPELLVRSQAKEFRKWIRLSGGAVRERWSQRPMATWDEVCRVVGIAEQLARWDDLDTAIEMAVSPEVRAEN